MKKSLVMIWMLLLAFSCQMTADNNQAASANLLNAAPAKKKARIQVALLLDTSNSIDGLINQAKSQLWKMVNELATSTKYGETPDIELALYDYGNSGIPANTGYVRQISPFTADLDLVSERLFSLSTSGGDEYCGKVILTAVNDLEWSDSNADLKMIFIAGNEPFTQGPIDYKDACQMAIKNSIIVNTIHCGDYETGVQTSWKDGADLADGKYLNINQDDEVVHISTPFDEEILKLNGSLNQTYIGFNNQSASRMEMQAAQDTNAANYGSGNSVERAVSKSKKMYNNASWDLVDAYEEDAEVLAEVEEEALPEEMKDLDEKERKVYIEEKKAEREKIQTEISELNKKREAYIAKEREKNAETMTLDNVMLKTVREQAVNKSFKFEEN
ncbi:MAG: vWA domain-containing protein [Bacteroidota bacterium]